MNDFCISKTPRLIASLFFFTLIFIALSTSSFAEAAKFNDKLKAFEPYLGTWESKFNMNGKEVTDVSRFERALNGTTLRVLHSIDNGVYGGESLMFWDGVKKQMVFYYFTTAGFHTQGHLEWQKDNSFVAFEDVSGNQSGITKVKSTSALQGDTMTVSTSYLKNDVWTKPESRTYRRSKKTVVFK